VRCVGRTGAVGGLVEGVAVLVQEPAGVFGDGSVPVDVFANVGGGGGAVDVVVVPGAGRHPSVGGGPLLGFGGEPRADTVVDGVGVPQSLVHGDDTGCGGGGGDVFADAVP